MPIVAILRQTGVDQDDTDERERQRWRTAQRLPPAGMRMASPYDPDALCGNKRRVALDGGPRAYDRDV